MGKETCQEIRGAFRHSKELGFKSLLNIWGSNQGTLVNTKKLRVGRKNEKGNKTSPQQGIHKLDGGENSVRDQTTHLQDWTIRLTKSNWDEKWWKICETIESCPMNVIYNRMKQTRWEKN